MKKIKRGDCIATAGLTPGQISEFLAAARDSGHGVNTVDPDSRLFFNQHKGRSAYIVISHPAGLAFGMDTLRSELPGGPYREIEWPPAPSAPGVWWGRFWRFVAFLAAMLLVMWAPS